MLSHLLLKREFLSKSITYTLNVRDKNEHQGKKGDLFLYCLYCRFWASWATLKRFEAILDGMLFLKVGFQMIATIATKRFERSLRL